MTRSQVAVSRPCPRPRLRLCRVTWPRPLLGVTAQLESTSATPRQARTACGRTVGVAAPRIPWPAGAGLIDEQLAKIRSQFEHILQQNLLKAANDELEAKRACYIAQ